MSSVNLPKGAFPVGSSQTPSKPIDSPLAQSSSITHKDTLEAASNNGIDTRLAPLAKGAPPSPPPHISIASLFRCNEAINAFDDGLLAFNSAQLEIRSQLRSLAVLQAIEL
jgi:hypothetical protein